MTAQCTANLEALSALIDGETTPEESGRLRLHLDQCPDCQAAYEAMGGVALKLITPSPLPRDFALRTARHVRLNYATAAVQLSLAQRLVGRFQNLWNHPLRQLVAPARRQRLRIGINDIIKFVCVFGAPTLALACLRDSAHLATFLTVAGIGLLVGIPVRHFSAEVALLGSLRRGRCLEEIMGTGISASSVVDALATQGMGELAKAYLPLVPVLLLGALALPADYRGMAGTVAFDWMPLGVLLFLVGSYATQFFLAWSGVTAAAIGLGSLILLPPLAFLSQQALTTSHFMLKVTAAAAWVAILGRGLAIWSLENPDRVEGWARRGLIGRESSRNRWLAGLSDNPITRRELARVSGSVPQGVKGIFLWRLSMVVMPLVWGLWASTQGDHWARAFWSGVALFSVAIFVRAASRTLPSIVHERERGSWESLLQTRLDLSTFVLGWLEVSLYTVFLESFLAVFVLVVFGLVGSNWIVAGSSATGPVETAILAGLTMLGACVIGSLMGLAISATSATTRQAGTDLLSWMLKAAGAWLLCWAASAAAFLPFMYDTGADGWVELLEHDAPLAAELQVGLGLWLWSWSVLRRNFGELEPARKAPVANAKGSYPRSLTLLDVASPAYLIYAASVMMFLATAGQTSPEPLKLSLGVVALLIGWFFLVRGPLATLAELLQGRMWSLLLGTLHGLLAGVGVQLLGGTVRALMQNQTLSRGSHWVDLLDSYGGLGVVTATVIMGLASGALSSRAAQPAPARAEVLRRRLVGLGSLSLMVFGGVAWWGSQIFSKTLHDSQLTERVLRGAQERSQASLRVPATRNGFALLRGTLYGNGTADWQNFSGLYGGNENRSDLVKVVPPIKARESFLGLAGLVEQALKMPEFVVPFDLDYQQRFPNFIRMRGIAQGMALLGFTYEAEGNLEQALNHYVGGMTWGDRMAGGGALMQEMMATALESIALHRVLSLETHHTLTPKQYRQLIQRVDNTRMGGENFRLSLENELANMWLFLDKSPAQRRQVEPQLGLPLPAFYLRYERTVTANVMEKWFPAISSLNVKELRRINAHEDLAEYPLASISRVLLPNINRAALNYASMLTRLEAVRVIAALNLYKLERGSWPTTLDALVGTYLQSSPRCYSSPEGKFLYEIREGQPTLIAPGLVMSKQGLENHTLLPYDEQQ